MELDSQTLSSFVLGVVVGLLVFIAVFLLARRRLRLGARDQIEQYEQTILDLRQERAEGRETNRRLRHELAISTPEHLESTRIELGEANTTIADQAARLAEAADQLTVRDRSLREARLAIQEIRLQLEEGRFGAASAHSAEYLDHEVAPVSSGEPPMPPGAVGEPLDDGVVAAELSGDDDPVDDGRTDDDPTADEPVGADEILVADVGPGEPVA